VTPVIARRFPAGKTVVVQNYPMPEELYGILGTPYAQRPPVICYAGGISEARGAYEMVDAIADVDARLDPRLHLAGEFVPASLRQELEKRRGWARTSALGVLDRAGIRDLLGSSRAGLVLLHPHPNHLNAQPIKLYEYMAAGLPVIASDFPLWQEIVGRNGAGLLIDPMDPNAIARAIEWVLDNPGQAAAMGSKGRAAVTEKLNWSEEEKKLLAMYEGMR
jgi:glycosyltransferase involved in cell wall biosynthesis